MKKIIFVDDDYDVLEALRTLFRRQRHEWDMRFCSSGQEALAELEQGAVDVVVSDMRMPVMDGAQLLQLVKERQPAAARIVLSGHADREAVLRALAVAHQYLGKPCDVSQLKAVIERTCQLQNMVHQKKIRDAVGLSGSLPSLPDTYRQLTEAVENPDIPSSDIAKIVEIDTAMAAKVLQLANSGYFGVARRITSIAQAVAYLGVDLMKGFVLTAHVFAAWGKSSLVSDLSLEKIQQQALDTAILARQLVTVKSYAEDAFTAGLVHDIGVIILALSFPTEYSAIARLCQSSQATLCEAERHYLDITHAEVGAYLLGVWGLPYSVVEAVAYHHTPELVVVNTPVGSDDSQYAVLMAVYEADMQVSQGERKVA